MSSEIEKLASRAFQLAEDIIQHAVEEQWEYVSLSPRFDGSADVRENFDILRYLEFIPLNIREIAPEATIELRGTKIRDIRPLAHVRSPHRIMMDNIPAVEIDNELRKIFKEGDHKEQHKRIMSWLERNKVSDPPDKRVGGPEFLVGDKAPIQLIDDYLVQSDDFDQEEMKVECLTKILELAQIADLAANTAPNLPDTVARYRRIIVKDSDQIGARSIWSVANSLSATLEVHERAVRDSRQSEELPAQVASKLKDVLQTHWVWFLGHPGARQVEERSRRHSQSADPKSRLETAELVVQAAEKSPDVSDSATLPAREYIFAAQTVTNSADAALGELEDWTWNFIASIAKRLWLISNAPGKSFVASAIAGYYLIPFWTANEDAIRQYAVQYMHQGPIWFDAISISIRKVSERIQNED